MPVKVMIVHFKKLNYMKIQKLRNVKTPVRGTALSAGLDFFMPDDVLPIYLVSGADITIPSGIKVEVPKGYALIAFNKSGIATKKHLQVGACVVDEDYQGEIIIHLRYIGKQDTTIYPGDKIIQFLLIPVFLDTVEVVDQVHTQISERAEGGFGSTGN